MTASVGPRAARRSLRGRETPRLWTKPLRKLTPETSHGFSVIEFALMVLGVDLYPWQKWLLIHALELNLDGTYRFRRVFVLVGRQNGKTKLFTVLALWWLFVDSDAFPEHLPASEFLVLGVAQNLDIAEKVWDEAIAYCDPEPEDEEAQRHAVPWLQALSRRPVKRNGAKALRLTNRAEYIARADGRGESAARVMVDELRQQRTWDQWAAVSKTKNSMFNSQLWAVSNAGDRRSIVLASLRAAALADIAAWEQYVESGIQSVEEFANTHNVSSALFEWSAADDCALDDIDGILQANPSIGYRPMFLESVLDDLAGGEPEADKRTEILCQWVTATVETHLDGSAWTECADPDSEPAADARLVLGVDTSADREMTYIAVVGDREDGRLHAEVIAQRPGMLWVVDAVVRAAKKNNITEVALQTRGAPAAEFAEPLEKAGLTVHRIEGTALGSSAGQTKDRVRQRTIRHRGDQESLNLAVSGAVSRKLNEVRVWDRINSVVDIAPVVAVSAAQWAHDNTEPPEPFVSAYEDDGLLVV